MESNVAVLHYIVRYKSNKSVKLRAVCFNMIYKRIT